MQDKDDKLDELFKAKLKEFKLPVSDKVLTNIKKEVLLENKRKGLGYGMWTLLILVMAGAAIGGYFIVSKGNKSTTTSISTTTISKEKENSSLTSSTSNPSLSENNTTSLTEKNKTNNDEKRKENITNSETATANSLNNSSSINEKTKPVNLLSSTTNKANESNNNNSKSNQKENNTINLQKSNNNNNHQPASANNSITNKSSSGENKLRTLNNNSKTKSVETTNATAKSSEATKQKEDVLNYAKENETKKLLQKTTDSINSTKEKERIKQNGIRNDSIQKYQLAKVEDSIKLKQNPPPPPLVEDKKENKKEDKKTSFFIGITGGPSFGNRTLTTGNNEGAANRNDNEKSVTTYNAGIDAGVFLKNNLVVNIGIRLNNKSETYHIGATAGFSDTTLTPIWDSTHFFIIGYTVDSIYTPGRNEFNAKNNYQWLSIPIMVGYNFSIKDKLFITPRVGVSIDYLLSGTSSWMDTKTNQIVEYTKSNGSFSNVTISGKINLDIGWNISKKWSLLLQPGYTRSLNSIYKKGDEMKLYPYSYDINLGVRFKF